MSDKVKRVSDAIDYIEAHLPEKFGLQALARAVHTSSYHLHRTFLEVTGWTAHAYAQRRRLTEAARALAFSDRPILEIALSAGYESQQAFTTAFKAMYKKTPRRYREDRRFYPLQLPWLLRETPRLPRPADWQNGVVLAALEDVSVWMALVRLIVDGFPGWREAEYEALLRRRIEERRAWILKDDEGATGVMLFTPQTGSVDFLGVHPQFRRRGQARAFLGKAMREFPVNGALCITTFRAGDKADPGYRAAFKRLGFAEAELLTEFGYPTQRFVLRRQGEEGLRLAARG